MDSCSSIIAQYITALIPLHHIASWGLCFLQHLLLRMHRTRSPHHTQAPLQ